MNDNDKDLSIEILPAVQEQMDADPEAAAVMKSFLEVLYSAHAGVKSGQYKTIDDGIEALTGHRPRKIVDGQYQEGNLQEDIPFEDMEVVGLTRLPKKLN